MYWKGVDRKHVPFLLSVEAGCHPACRNAKVQLYATVTAATAKISNNLDVTGPHLSLTFTKMPKFFMLLRTFPY